MSCCGGPGNSVTPWSPISTLANCESWVQGSRVGPESRRDGLRCCRSRNRRHNRGARGMSVQGCGARSPVVLVGAILEVPTDRLHVLPETSGGVAPGEQKQPEHPQH